MMPQEINAASSRCDPGNARSSRFGCLRGVQSNNSTGRPVEQASASIDALSAGAEKRAAGAGETRNAIFSLFVGGPPETEARAGTAAHQASAATRGGRR